MGLILAYWIFHFSFISLFPSRENNAVNGHPLAHSAIDISRSEHKDWDLYHSLPFI